MCFFEVEKFASAEVKKTSCTEYRQFQHCCACHTSLKMSYVTWRFLWNKPSSMFMFATSPWVKNVPLDLEVKERDGISIQLCSVKILLCLLLLCFYYMNITKKSKLSYCSGLTLAALQVPTKDALSFPFSAGKGRENTAKRLIVMVKSGNYHHSPITLMGKTDSAWES